MAAILASKQKLQDNRCAGWLLSQHPATMLELDQTLYTEWGSFSEAN